MTTPKLLAVVAALTVLSGCVAGPAPTPTPTPSPTLSYVPYTDPDATPTSSVKPSGEWEWVPGPLRSGPTPGTVLGPTGKVLRLIPADPTLSFKCRSLTATERTQLAGDGLYDRSKPTRAVDLPEGFSILGYWPEGQKEPSTFISGTRFTGLGSGSRWYGSHTNAGIAFEDGPKAQDAVLECVS